MITTKSYLNELTYKVNGAAIEVHKALGPGLLESVYHECLRHEFRLQGINFVSEMGVPVDYKGIEVQTKLRCDFFIENILMVELKAIKEVMPINRAQLLTYMKLLDAPKGIMYNFNVVNLYHEGQETFVNHLFADLPE